MKVGGWEWWLLALPFGTLIFLAVQIWRVVRSEEFQRDVRRLREQRQMRRAARRRA